MDYSLSGFSVYGIFQAGIQEWIGMMFKRMWDVREKKSRVIIKTMHFTGTFEMPQITFY